MYRLELRTTLLSTGRYSFARSTLNIFSFSTKSSHWLGNWSWLAIVTSHKTMTWKSHSLSNFQLNVDQRLQNKIESWLKMNNVIRKSILEFLTRNVLFEFHLKFWNTTSIGIPVRSLLWGWQTSNWSNGSTKRNKGSMAFK